VPEERRVVTLLFADVTSSTSFAEATDPEDVRALMTQYYRIATQVIAEHGGTLEKFIGDSVMAVFGLRLAHGDDAERACAAALALRERVASDPVTGAIRLRRLAARFLGGPGPRSAFQIHPPRLASGPGRRARAS